MSVECLKSTTNPPGVIVVLNGCPVDRCPVRRSVQFARDGHGEGASIGVEHGALGDGIPSFPEGQVVESGYLKLVDFPLENAVDLRHDDKEHHLT